MSKRAGGFTYTPVVSVSTPFKKKSFTGAKARRISPGARDTFKTVPRTRGVYAQGEMKYFDTFKAVTAIPASADWTATEFDPATINTIFDPTQGNSISQRIGQKCQLHKLKIKGTVDVPKQVDRTTPDNASVIRIILFQDMQTNSTQAQGEELMRTEGTAPKNINSFQNFNEFGRFRVWKDKTFTMQNPNLSYDGTNMEQQGISKQFKMNLNFTKDPCVVRFNATNGGTVADIIDNSFHLLAIASDIDLGPTLQYVVRCGFKG